MQPPHTNKRCLENAAQPVSKKMRTTEQHPTPSPLGVSTTAPSPPALPNHHHQNINTTTSTIIANAPPAQTTFVSETLLPTDFGDFRVRAYRCTGGHPALSGMMEPVALICDPPSPTTTTTRATTTASPPPPPTTTGTALTNEHQHAPVVVRVHDACATSEIFGSKRCDCREQLHCAMEYIQTHGGVVIYLQQEGRGIGLANKIAAYALQQTGVDTVDANRMLGFEDDLRQYAPVQHILNDLNIKDVVLMTNNPRKSQELSKLGINIVGRMPILATVNEYNSAYLKSKSERMAHVMNGVSFSVGDGGRSSGGNNTKRRRATTGAVVQLPFVP